MFDRFNRAWELGKQSSQVLNKDPELLTYPFLATLCCLLIAVPCYMQFDSLFGSQVEPAIRYTSLFVITMLVVTIYNFWDVALMCAARSRLLGGDPSFTTGIACAFRRLGRVLMWSLWSTFMKLFADSLREQGRKFNFVSDAIEGAWSVVSYFALPVMVFEGASTTTALSRSKEIACRTWGTALGGYVGLRALTEMLIYPAVFAFLACFFFAGEAAAEPAIIVLIVYAIVVSLYVSALEQVYRVQVYLDAQNAPPQPVQPVYQTRVTEVMDGPMPSTRPTRMCPRCLDPLAAHVHGEVTVDACARCGGLWLDKGETDRLLAAGPLPQQLANPPATRSDTQYRGSGQRECPACETLMALKSIDGIQVDHCRQCGGVFFDRGELSKIKS